jgi:hypothetical protein
LCHFDSVAKGAGHCDRGLPTAFLPELLNPQTELWRATRQMVLVDLFQRWFYFILPVNISG